ncbi:MAG: hypothetical protein JW892_17545 [Anaerolineae bacterium]|nr:hypothetical protein [Anaerolineae bacterium]
MPGKPFILALDQSTTHVGWCVGEGLDYVESGVFIPTGKEDTRLMAIYGFVVRMLNRHKPDVLAIEEPAGDRGNRRVDRLLGELKGFVKAAAYSNGLKPGQIAIVYPTTVKATGVHKNALSMASAICGKQVTSPDEADAIGVWLATASNLTRREK